MDYKSRVSKFLITFFILDLNFKTSLKIHVNFAYLVEEPAADGHIERVVVENYFV